MPSELLERIEPNFDIDSWARPLGFALMVVHVLLRAPLLVHADASTPKSSLLRSETKAKSRWAGRWDANGGQSRSLITWVRCPRLCISSHHSPVVRLTGALD